MKSKKYLKLVILAAIIFTPLIYFIKDNEDKNRTVRAALDIGSGATKLKIAEINVKTNKIEKVLVNESFAVQYQEELEKSKDGTFNDGVMNTGLEALKKSREIAQKHKAEKIVAVATASFRKAANVDSFIDRIQKETGIEVHIIDQELEGILGFEATKAQIDHASEDIVIWDIGGGSYQFSTLDQNKNIVVYRGLDASIPFKNHVIKKIKLDDPKNVGTPNPLNNQEIHAAGHEARKLSEKVDRVFKQKISNPNTKIVGIGNIFAYGIHPLIGKKESFTKQELLEKIKELEGKTDHCLGNGPYSNVAVTNPILILGFMEKLGIEKMQIADVNNADGALLYSAFWESKDVKKIG